MTLTAEQVRENGVNALNRLAKKAALRRVQAERIAYILCARTPGPCSCDEILRDAMRYAREVVECPNHDGKSH